MGPFTKGKIIVIDFPFSNLEETKRRPAYVAAESEEDFIMCQITSKPRENSVEINPCDFLEGNLKQKSFVRIDKIFTIEKNRIAYSVGKLEKIKVKEIQDKISFQFNIN